MNNPVLLLLAEDETAILMLVQDVLEEAGYTVLCVVDGDEALAVVEDRYADLLGLVTDIRLGSETSGWDLAHRARELNPVVSVVYMSGDSAHEWAANGVPKSVMLQKPFANAQLVTAISSLLNEAGANAVPPAAPESA